MATIEGCAVGWDCVADMFSLDPAVLYLNHGGFGAVPVAVQRAQQRLRTEMEQVPMRFFGPDLLTRLEYCRRRVADFLGADPDGTALVTNATAGVAVVLNTMADLLRPGMSILTTDHGYGSIDLAVAEVCRRTGTSAQRLNIAIGSGPDQILDSFRDKLNNGRYGLAIIDQITSPTAQATPTKQIVELLRSAGVPTLVDGAHAAGQLDLNVADVDADFWVGNLHKWAFTPRGTGALVVAPQWRARVRPLITSWNAPAGFPAAVEFVGTTDYTAWLSAPTALHVLRTLGPDRVRQHNIDLARYGQQAVAAALHQAGLSGPLQELPGSGAHELAMRLVPVNTEAIDRLGRPDEVAHAIGNKVGAWMAVSSHGDHRYLRLSAQVYNARTDYDRVAAMLPGILSDRGHRLSSD
jgi:isopenicillin-N epimerase